MKTEELLDLIEKWGVMPPMQVANLRRQMAQAEYPVHPVLMARRLVEEGYINSYFAKTLLAGGPLANAEDAPSTSSRDDYRLSPLAGGMATGDVEGTDDDEEYADLQLADLELPPIEGADWLTRSADLEVAGSLPSLAAKAAKKEEEMAGPVWLRWAKAEGPAGLPWWILGLAAVGAFSLLILLIWMLFGG